MQMTNSHSNCRTRQSPGTATNVLAVEAAQFLVYEHYKWSTLTARRALVDEVDMSSVHPLSVPARVSKTE